MSQQQAQTLFERMKAAGQLQPDSEQIIIANMDATMAAIVVGTEAEKLGTEDPITLLLVLDRSGSLAHAKDDVIQGLHNLVMMGKKLYKKFGTEVLLGIITFGERGRVLPLVPFTLIDQIDPAILDSYNPTDDETALVEGVFYGLAGSAGHGFSLYEEGIRGGKRIMTVLTDGQENTYSWDAQGKAQMAADCQRNSNLMKDLRRPKQNIFGLIGVGYSADYTDIGTQMGFKTANIVTVASGPGSLARAMEIVSNSMELHSVAQSTGQSVGDQDGDVLLPTGIVTDEEAEDDLFN